MSKAAKRERQRQNRELAKEAAASAARRARLWRGIRSFAIIAVVVVAVAGIFTLIKGNGSSSKKASITRTYKSAPKMTIDPTKQYAATIDTSEGTIVTALDAKTAPTAVNDFVFLAKNNFYNGLCIDRASQDFMVQGGSPKCDQQGGPGYTVRGEVPTDHYAVGSLAAAKLRNEPTGTMGSQIFIVTGTQGATLPNDYARFGSVTSGLDVAKQIEKLAPSTGDGKPTKNVKIKKITITESPATGASSGSTSTSAP